MLLGPMTPFHSRIMLRCKYVPALACKLPPRSGWKDSASGFVDRVKSIFAYFEDLVRIEGSARFVDLMFPVITAGFDHFAVRWYRQPAGISRMDRGGAVSDPEC